MSKARQGLPSFLLKEQEALVPTVRCSASDYFLWIPWLSTTMFRYLNAGQIGKLQSRIQEKPAALSREGEWGINTSGRKLPF